MISASLNKKRAGRRVDGQTCSTWLLWLWDYSLPSRFAFESVRYVRVLLSGMLLDRLPEVAVVTGNDLIAKSEGRCYKKKHLDLAGPVFHGFQFHNHLGALETTLFHIVEHLPDHLADRLNRGADLAAIFHLS